MQDNSNITVGAAVVVGGGIGGMQSALDLAESGIKVYLVETSPSIGGRMVQLDKTFPTNECAMCIVSPKLVDCARHLNIEIISYSDIESIEGEPGNFTVTLKKKPRYVSEEKCTGCGACALHCPVRNEITLSSDDKKDPVEVPPEIKSEVDAMLEKYTDPGGMLIGILQDIQTKFNYLRQDTLMYLSEKLTIPLSQLYGVASFYNVFSLNPRGKNIIRVCMGTACHLKGSGNIAEAISRELNIDHDETTSDLLFTLEKVNCLGACALAPVVTVNNKYYGKMTINKMLDVIDTCREQNEKVVT